MGESVVGERAARRAMSEIVPSLVMGPVLCWDWGLYFLAGLQHNYSSVHSKLGDFNFNLLFCLQDSTTAIIFETLKALLDVPPTSRFETVQIFLKSNFKIWIYFSIFPQLENDWDDIQNLRHFNSFEFGFIWKNKPQMLDLWWNLRLSI